MPTLTDRRTATQRKALARQRLRLAKLARERKALARLRAAIRKAKSTIARRQKLIDQGEGVRITGNVAHGGTPRERLKAVALAAAEAHSTGRRKSFYSMTGAWTVDYAITGEPKGYRSDCSQFVTSVYKSAGLPDPNSNGYMGGYTGTLGARGRETKDPKPGDLGFYGPYPHHHVEMYVGDGKFVGHGSPPVDGVTPGWPDSFRSYL
jgi:cell wall-associated NlpC family hydrolase